MNIVVVAALIKKDDKILIAKRATGDENVLGKWELPGGKVEISTVDLMNGIKPSLRKGWRFFSVIFYENML